MLRILTSIAAAAGAVILLLVLLLLLALVPRVRVDVDKAQDGPLALALRYGWLRFRLLPRKKKEKPKKKPPAKPKPKKKPEKTKEKKGGFSLKGIDIGDTICLVLDILIELRNRLRIHRLRADVMLATGDAAKTGILLGRIAAISGMILPILEQNFVISDFQILVDGDFQCETPSTRAAFAVSVSIRPIHLPLILLKFRRQLLALYRALRTDSRAEKTAREPAASEPTQKANEKPINHDTEKENAT